MAITKTLLLSTLLAAGLQTQTLEHTALPRPVRNGVPQAGQEIVTIRYFRIRKGTFDEFLKVSVEGVWPFFEKIGARVIGMWKVDYAGVPGEASKESPDYDEVYLSTRYASLEHWRATRQPQLLGGNGPDFEAYQKALTRRAQLSIVTTVTILRGRMAPGGPFFMPGLPESYRRK